MRIEIQWNSLFPLSMPYVTTLQYREIFWQNGSLLYGSDTAKQEFFMRLQLRLQSLHKHDFISNQLLFYCWLTQQHFNFSVSFSFKREPLKLFRFHRNYDTSEPCCIKLNHWKNSGKIVRHNFTINFITTKNNNYQSFSEVKVFFYAVGPRFGPGPFGMGVGL